MSWTSWAPARRWSTRSASSPKAPAPTARSPRTSAPAISRPWWISSLRRLRKEYRSPASDESHHERISQPLTFNVVHDMPVRPVIGITTQTLDAIPGELPRCWVMSQRYVLALAEAGGVPQLVPLLCDDPETLRLIYERLDGILLPGGVDIDPSVYGAARSPLCGRTDPDRDQTELMLTRWAMEERKPVLGICRGAQLINVAAGGTLYQDIATERTGAIKHDYFPNGEQNPRNQLVHDVELTGGRVWRTFSPCQARA